MQVSRSLRCLQRHQSLRALHFFRGFNDAFNSTGQHKHQQCCTLLFSDIQRHFSSPSGNETQLSDSSSLQSATSKEKSAQISQTDPSPVDGFDISELESKMNTVKPNKINPQQLLKTWYNEIQDAKENNKSEEVLSQIQRGLQSVVHMTLIDKAPPEERLQCLRLLLSLDKDVKLSVKLLRNTVMSAQYFPIKFIADIVYLLSNAPPTDERSRTRKELVVATVGKRWFEIGSKQIVFFLYQLDELFDMKDICLRNKEFKREEKDGGTENDIVKIDSLPVNNNNLEKRLIVLIDELKPKDLARVINLMAKWRNRNKILLLAFFHRLSLADMTDFSLIQFSNLLFACSVLNLNNSALLKKIVPELSNREFSSPAIMSSLLTSLSRLQWYDPNFVSKCLAYLADGKVNELSPRELWNVLMSLANLYALPLSDEEMSVIKALGQRSFKEAKSTKEKVDIAWCLSILKLLDADIARQALEPSVIQAFDGDKTFQKLNAMHKLQGVNLSAKFEVEGYSGPLMEEIVHNTDLRHERSAAHRTLVSSLTDTLGKFVDMNSYVRVSQHLPGGLYADAIMCTGPDGSPKPLSDLEKDEAENLHSLAIQVIPFFGMLSSHSVPCGVHQMAARHLHHLGYAAVQIPYSSLRKSQSVLEHVNAIQSLIQKAVSKNVTETDSASPSMETQV